MRSLEFQNKVAVIDKAPGDHFIGDLADKAVLEAFAESQRQFLLC